jgi:nucleoside-diphosphate-sugar epimerase
MKVLVSGATGAIGIPLVEQLHAAGHEVLGITRSEGGAHRLRLLGAQAVVADVMNRGKLLEAVDGLAAEAVVHEATAFRELGVRHSTMQNSNALRIDGTRNMIDAARLVGARRFLAQSMIFGYGYGDHGRRVLTEQDTYAPAGRNAKLEQHLGAMRSLERQTFGAAGLEGITLRYGLFYGRDHTMMNMVTQLRKRHVAVPRGGGGVASWVFLEDAAAATVAALVRGRPGEAYNVVDDEPVSWGTFLTALGAQFGAKPPRQLPSWMFRSLGYIGVAMTSVVRVSNEKARTELGWAPTAATYHQGLPRLARALETATPEVQQTPARS